MEETKTLFKNYINNYPKEKIQKAIDLHNEFLQNFPRESIKDMTLEQYALGKTRTGSFSWWLEYHTIPLGSIKGGSAIKHVIYFSHKDSEWKFPNQFTSVEQAWTRLRQDIIELLDVYNQEPYKTISEDNLLYTANMLRGKILYLYHPDKFLPIYKLEHLQDFLKALNVPEAEWVGKDNLVTYCLKKS